MIYKKVILSLVVFFVLVLAVSAKIFAESENGGKILFESKCMNCHPLSKSLDKTKSLDDWQKTTLRMSQKKNSNITKEEAEHIAEYLSL